MRKAAKILIVEDDPHFRDFLKKVLALENYQIYACETGSAAISWLARNSVDIILLDIGLPDMDGNHILDYSTSINQDNIVIVITGDEGSESESSALCRGAYDYLKKPVKIAEILKTVENAIVHKRLEKDYALEKHKRLESEESLMEIFDRTIVGRVIIQQGIIVCENEEFGSIFRQCGCKDKKIKFDSIHSEDSAKIREFYDSIISGEIDRFDTDFRWITNRKDNLTSHRWIKCIAFSIKFKGKFSLIVNCVDITKYKEMELQALTKSKMYSLGRIAAGIAHEIRNPLTGINGYLWALDSLCASKIKDPADAKMGRNIIGQIQVASAMIELVVKRVMDFSKPGTPKMDLIDINEPLEAAIKLTSPIIRKKGIKLKKALSQNLPKCYADPHLIGQVLLNLTTNAANILEKCAETKEIEVKSYADNNTLFISVGDSGPGVSTDLKDKIFEPFVTSSADGSGIGLSIAQRIVTDHDGLITQGDSELGGAEFKVELPIERRNTAKW